MSPAPRRLTKDFRSRAPIPTRDPFDIGLPDQDGLELCREIRGFNQQTPILFYTAFAELLDEEEARKAGAQGWLRKPEDTARLGEVVRDLIAKAN